VERQCKNEMVEKLRNQVQEVEAIISMGCGVVVQALAEIFDEKSVFTALNTSFIGKPRAPGIWTENCSACGDCMLHWTRGICPVTRCAKGLLNGPCGAVRPGGYCEIDPEKECAWCLIYRGLEKQGRLNLMMKYYEPKNYRAVKRLGRIESIKAQEWPGVKSI
jgi:hypothetical protein